MQKMTREELIEKINKNDGKWLCNNIEFTVEGEDDRIKAKDKVVENSKFYALHWHSLEISNWYLPSLDYVEELKKHLDFLARLFDAIGHENPIADHVTVETTKVEEKIVEKEVEVIPQLAKDRMREADKLEGKVEAFESIILKRKVTIED